MSIIRWDRKPPEGTKLNRSHPMVRDMIFFCPMTGARDQIDLITGTVGVRVEDAIVNAQALQRQTGRYGIHGGARMTSEAVNSATAGWDFGHRTDWNPENEITLLSQQKPRKPFDYLNGGYSFCKRNTLADTSADWSLRTFGSTDNLSGLRFRTSSYSDLTVDKPAAGEWTNVWVDQAGFQNATQRGIYVWDLENGDALETVSGTTGVLDTGTGPVAISHRGGDKRVFAGDIDYCAAWSVSKSKQFIDDFRQDPWQIFEPRKASRATVSVLASLPRLTPKIESVASNNEAVNATTHTVTMPAGITTGDLLITVIGIDLAATITFTGWTVLYDVENTGVQGAAYYRIADETEGATQTFTTGGANEQSANTCYRISGYSGTPEIGTTATGSSNTPNPPIVTPSGGEGAYLFLACASHDNGSLFATEWPDDYRDWQTNSRANTAGGAGVLVAALENNLITSSNPTSFRISGGEQWVTNTIAIAGTTTTVFITDVNGTETWTDGTTGLVITGSGFVGLV